MFKPYLLFTCLILLIASCKQGNSSSGTYLIYKIEDSHKLFISTNQRNDSLERMLMEYFQNKRYQVDFHDQFVSLHPTSNGKELILSKVNNEGYAEYHLQMYEGKATMHFDMATEEGTKDLLLAIDLYFPNGYQRPFIPVQLPTNDQENKHGFIVCHLTKAE